MPSISRSKSPLLTSRVHQISEELRRRIEQGSLGDGERLMTEGDVAKEFGVSRTLAREAVSQLRALGLVEGRQNIGLIVRHPDPVRLMQSCLPTMGKSPQGWAELATFRYVLEVGAIELAISHATEDQITQLTKLAADFAKAVHQHNVPLEKKLDLAFHSLLLEMTGSTFLAGMQRVLSDFFQTLAVKPRPELHAPVVEDGVGEHIDLAAAIRDRDLDRARSIIRRHFRQYLQVPGEPDRKQSDE